MNWRATLSTAKIPAALIAVALPLLFSTPAKTSDLSRVFVYDMLNAQIPYLEHLVGPAMHIFPGPQNSQIRSYEVDGCDVDAIAHTDEQGLPSIQAYSLDLSPSCGFNFAAFRLPALSTDDLAISKVPFANSLGFESDCIDMCGNAVDPSVDFIQQSSHASNWIGVVYTIVLVDDSSINATMKLVDVMKAAEGSDYVEQTRFNCDQRYAPTAVGLFANIPVNKVTVGVFSGDAGGRCQ